MKEVQSFVATRSTFEKRRFTAAQNPTRDNCFSMAQAAFAVSMARIRLLRQTDTHGHLLLSAHKQAASMRQALITFSSYDPCVQQTELGL